MYDKNNIFAKIISGEIPCNKIYEDEYAVAFHDINPKAKIHALVLPKGEYTSLVDFAQKAAPEIVKDFFEKVSMIASMLELDETGFRILANHGPDATQTVMHFHVHILGGERLSAF